MTSLKDNDRLLLDVYIVLKVRAIKFLCVRVSTQPGSTSFFRDHCPQNAHLRDINESAKANFFFLVNEGAMRSHISSI